MTNNKWRMTKRKFFDILEEVIENWEDNSGTVIKLVS